ncbi:LysR substrate-binding domain-containing protein [Streptomyces noursei]|uniref:LysR substrate-binding domain-containing protein n=1 Tax=Streptomyces noursei TaxID=1971 RepID=UPI0030EFEEE6
MDAQSLPNLASLRSLEAAARLRSYTLAARELHVTHSAVSHQIRQLEAQLGVALFARSGTQMLPTPVCARLAARLRRSLGDLVEALGEAMGEAGASSMPLELSVMADFANVWLIPRLADLARAHLQIELSVRLHTGMAPPDPRSVDRGIWHRPVEAHDHRSVRLLEDQVIAVCSPGLTARHPGLTLGTLPQAPLLRFALRSWKEFFAAAGIDAGEPAHGVIYSDAEALLRAALAGQGVAMVRRQMADAYLGRGDLVRIGDVEIRAQLDYFLSWREGHPRASTIHTFHDWLRQQLTAAPEPLGTGDDGRRT